MATDLKDLARRLGVTEKELQRSYEAKGLADRAERMRVPLELHERASAELPRYARRLLAEDDKGPAVLAAIELCLVNADQSTKEALAAMEQLALADQVPAVAAPARKVPKVRERPASAAPSAFDEIVAALQDGPLTRPQIEERLGKNGRCLNAAFGNLLRYGHARKVGDAYELVNGGAHGTE